MKPRVGKVQRGVRRGLIASDGVPQPTASLLPWCYPRAARFELKHYQSLWRAAPRFAIKLGRRGKGNLWAPNAALLKQIRDE
jgi:hypothetical protein